MRPGEIVHHVVNGLLATTALCLIVLTLNYYFMGPSRRFRERLDWETSKATTELGRRRYVHAARHGERSRILAGVLRSAGV